MIHDEQREASSNIRYLGIDLGGTTIKYGRVTETGVIEHQASQQTVLEGGRDALLSQLCDIGEELLREAKNLGLTVPYVGIVSPGTVDANSGCIMSASPNIPDWVGAEVTKTLENRLKIPVLIENDARGMALAEFRFGAGRNVSSALCLTVGTGIGGAIIINNQLWQGHNQSAGEIGHTIIDVDNSLTGNNLQGSLENLTSAKAIERRMQELVELNGSSEIIDRIKANTSSDSLRARGIFEAYNLGDVLAKQCLEVNAKILGQALAGFVNLINPEIVIIGGGVIDAIPEMVSWTESQIRSSALTSATSELTVARAQLGNSAGLIGAALLGKENPWRELLKNS